MANRPANAGSGRGLAPMGDVAPPLDAAVPPPIHHEAPPPVPRGEAPPPRPAAPRAAVGHRTARRLAAREREAPRASLLAWVPYLIVLAGAAAGMFVVWQGSKYAGRGTALLGCSLLAAALGRLILPPRYAGLLSTRRKATDVLTFAVLGTAVIAVALTLP